MKIAVKYCGGCNPRYQRQQIPQRLQQDFPAAQVVTGNFAGADAAVVVCGCHSRCAGTAGIAAKHGIFTICHSEEYPKLLANLTAALCGGSGQP